MTAIEPSFAPLPTKGDMYCFQAVTDCATVMSAWESRSGSLNARCLEPLAMAAWALAFQVEPAAAFHLVVLIQSISDRSHMLKTRSKTASDSGETVIDKKTHNIGTYSTPELRLPLGA